MYLNIMLAIIPGTLLAGFFGVSVSSYSEEPAGASRALLIKSSETLGFRRREDPGTWKAAKTRPLHSYTLFRTLGHHFGYFLGQGSQSSSPLLLTSSLEAPGT